MRYANEHKHGSIYPYEVIRQISKKRLEVRAMKAIFKDDHSSYDQKWNFESDENGQKLIITLREDGKWRALYNDSVPNFFTINRKPQRYMR